MGGYFANAGTFLVETLFELYILAVMLRFLFQLFRAEFYNPISQFLVTVTNPILRPLRRWIPGFRGIDVAGVVLMVILKVIELKLIALISGYAPGLGGLLVLSIADLLQLLIYIFLIAILIHVIISWVAPGSYNPMISLLYSLCEPLLRPARRRIPPIAGLDLSPLVVLIILQLVLMVFVAPLADFGRSLL